MKHIFIILTAAFLQIAANAQSSGKISGNVKDAGSQRDIDGATVSLLRAKDSSLVKVAIATREGQFVFENVKNGGYLVSANSIGHKKVFSQPIELTPDHSVVDLGTIQLATLDKNLKEVVVTSKKLLIEQKIDKTVINVDAAISNEGTTALEVLEKSPGVTVDKDGNVSLKGKQGVMIMIDGKPSYLSGQDLANLLRSMPSNMLDQVEIMTNPSAKYDAAGNSGIINLKTKKNKQRGFNGSLNMAYGQSAYGRTNNSLNLNYRTGKLNLFGNIGANYSQSYRELDIQRKYKKEDGSIDAIFEQTAPEWRYNSNFNSKIGADFYASKKTTFGIVLTGYSTPGNHTAFNTSFLKDNKGITDSIVTAGTKEKSSWRNGAVNLNFRHQYDSTGREITADLDYLTYNSNKDQFFKNTSYTPGWDEKNFDQLLGELPSLINIYSGKVDYTHPLKSGLKIESGLKTSFVETNNTAGYFNMIGDNKVPDYDKTNQFNYRENINAAYVNLSRQIKKWGLQAGLRAENTNYSGRQYGNPQRPDSAFKKSYTSLFPTFYVSYNASEKNQLGFSYGRRINRPAYEDLNPFLFFIDKYTYGSGNPFLKPSYADAFEVSHTYHQFLTTTVNYTHTRDLFSETFEQKGYATVVKEGNFGKANSASISVSAQVPSLKWWTPIIYTEYNYNDFEGLVGGDQVHIKAGNFLVNINNQFKFTKGWSAELSGFYRTSGIEGQILLKPMGQLNLGLQKQILKNKGTVKVNVRDLLNTMTARGEINFQNTEAHFQNYRDARIVTLSFAYRFGKPITGLQKRKTGGAGTEEDRVKGGN